MRSLFGTLLLIILMVLYVGAVLTLAEFYVAGTHWLVQLIFYIAAGIAWTWPAKWLLNWVRPKA